MLHRVSILRNDRNQSYRLYIINFNYIEEYFSFDLIQKNITFLYYKRILHLLKRFFNYF